MRDNIVANSFDKIDRFEVIDHEDSNNVLVKDLLRAGKFDVQVNNQKYSVYPDYTQLLPENNLADGKD